MAKKKKGEEISPEIEELEVAEASEKKTPETEPIKKARVAVRVAAFIGIMLVLAGTVTFGIYFYASKKFSETSIAFSVNNPRKITLSDGDPFVEPGYSAAFCVTPDPESCEDVSQLIVVKNPNEEEIARGDPGQYEISYSLDFTPRAYDKERFPLWTDTFLFYDEREITVVDQAPPEIRLEGESSMLITVGDEFVEPGYSAVDAHDGDLTEKVEVSGGVDTSRVGVYTLTYSVTDSSGNLAETATRVVSVVGAYHPWYAAQWTQTNNFDELRDYIQYNGWDVSFGYYNLETGYEYTYQADKLYYGASLVKTIDAMYAYETGQADDKSTIASAITFSNNSAHIALVNRFGIDNLRNYAANIGMTHHLKPSQIYTDTYYFCDTTVNDQLTEWKYLWTLINTLPDGWELREYFINSYWDNLSFDGSPRHMYKNGLFDQNYHEVGIMFANSPYIVVFLTTIGLRRNSTTIIKDLSNRVYLINDLVAAGAV